MTAYLLDVNVLLAVVDTRHVHHERVQRWYSARGEPPWATCPITENGFVRILSQPSYPNRLGDTPTAVALLRRMCERAGHQFWPDDVTLRDILTPDAAITHHHVTDVYLLGLAARRGGWFATLDDRIPAAAVAGGPGALELISA